ncbi:ribosome silencing factor [Candidatus Magnetominusculus xianensis]|uniref:Ribosomal silencing factor RsfS n=1 Tax=Candidatus Magnetominusculus xianensis TaxID=1748249 RepID=A0ABR5SFV4_9BACT|nr:ribosome silencing factor [Candidatus Magnetominusculus xianensis]KWT83472.1 ribosomal silencing factor RsfS [Candidatus Magnetominusculus xianensis]
MQNIPEKAEIIIKALQAKMARDIITLEMFEVMAAADYMIICTGENPPQIRALAENVELKLREFGRRPMSIQGLSNAKWVLLDYGDVLVNIFDDEYRRYYELEKLWLDAPRRIEPDDTHSGKQYKEFNYV